jgi:hypothetical protein
MERRTLSQERANVEVINGVEYEVRMVKGRKSLIERGVVATVESEPQLPVHTPVQSLDDYTQMSSELEMRRRAALGAQLMAARATQEAEEIGNLARQTEKELNILAFQTMKARDEARARQRQQELYSRSGDPWTPALKDELEELLQEDGAIEAAPMNAVVSLATQPDMEKPFDAFIDNIGQSKKKPRFSHRRRVVMGGAAGVLALVVGAPMAMNAMGANKQADIQAVKPATNISPEEQAAIAKKANPDITPASIALGQCLEDSSRLFGGHASGTSSEAWVFKATDGTLKGAQTSDQKYLPIEVQSAPFDVAACVPSDARGAMVTMKDRTITIDKSKVTPQMRMALGGTVMPTTQEFAARPEIGLTDAGAKALNAAQTNTDNKNSVATIAYANVARAIAQTGSTDLGRVEAQMDADLLQSVDDQIKAFYKKQGRDAPVFTLSLTGDYLAPKVVDPAALPDILTKTKDIVRLTPTTLTALDFNAVPVPNPTGK